ncbi:MAG: aminotransferase class I/II-fold pyridoxal phosphate-dependent enzyme [Chloroflexota bacterium]
MGETLAILQERFNAYKAMNLTLNMQRGQPSDLNFDLSNEMLTIVNEDILETPSGVALRNYPGGVAGLVEARELFGEMLGVKASEMIVGNNASLELMASTLKWAMLKGLKDSDGPWFNQSPKMIVTIPGYDRHFKLLEIIGYELISVPMTADGPAMDEVQKLAAADPSIKGIFFVPTYSNPTGDSISDDSVRRLVSMKTAAPDFTIFADDAYVVHHLTDEPVQTLNLLRAAEEAGNPDRVVLFGSTSKITFASGGIGFMASSAANVAYLTKLMGFQTIGPNKIEQYRHVRFLKSYKGGLKGLMAKHKEILKPKFTAVQDALAKELNGTDLATWTNPKGGYFVSLDTARPVADRVVTLAKEAGVALTPAGAPFPGGIDPNNKNIRLSPSRPPVEEVSLAMEIVAVCVKLASAEYDAD